jgi:transposase-like protein
MIDDFETRQAVVALLARGEVTVSDAARLAGVSRQTARYWATSAGVQWRKIRRRRLAVLWRREMHNGSRLVEKPAPAAGAHKPPRRD